MNILYIHIAILLNLGAIEKVAFSQSVNYYKGHNFTGVRRLKKSKVCEREWKETCLWFTDGIPLILS